jgi:hypothetical protein
MTAMARPAAIVNDRPILSSERIRIRITHEELASLKMRHTETVILKSQIIMKPILVLYINLL